MADKPIPYYVRNAAGDDGFATVARSGKVEDTDANWARLTSALTAGQVLVKMAPGLGVSAPKPGQQKVNVATGVFADLPQTPVLPIAAKLKEIRAACATGITRGFRSTALNPGADQTQAYFYPSDMTSQINLLHGSPLMCRDASNAWALRDHTDAQLATVRMTFGSLLASCRTRLTALEAQVLAAKTQADLDAVTWGKSTT